MAVPISRDLSTLPLPLNFCFHLSWKEGLLLLLLLQSLPPLHFHYRLHSNSKDGLLLLVLLQSLPPMAVPISWDISALLLPLSLIFHLNRKEGLLLLLLLQSLPPLHFWFSFAFEFEGGTAPSSAAVVPPSSGSTNILIYVHPAPSSGFLFSFELEEGTDSSTVAAVPPSSAFLVFICTRIRRMDCSF